MTFNSRLKKVNLLLVLALLAALLIPVMGVVAAGQSIAFNEERLESGSAQNAHTDLSPITAIACECPDPGSGTGGCC